MRNHPYIKAPRLRQASPHLRTEELVPILLDSPHSGVSFPPYARAERNRILRKDKDFFRRYADLYVDELVSKAVDVGANIVSAPYARSFVDLNRACDDIFPSQKDEASQDRGGRGGWSEELRLSLFWRSMGEVELWDYLPPSEINRRLRWIWRAYHDLVRSQLLGLREKFGVGVLLNCHSMSSNVAGLGGCHVVLGDNMGQACSPALLDFVFDFFISQGLKVAVNQPFSGGSIICGQAMTAGGLHALQIEIRRDLYMDEVYFRRSDNFGEVASLFMRLVENLGKRIKSGFEL